MARGQLAQDQLSTTNQIGAQQNQASQALESQLTPLYTSMLSEGYTPEQKNAMTTAGMGAEAGAFDAESNAAQNRVAATKNDAGFSAEEDQLARDKGTGMGTEAANLQAGFANQEQANQKFGAQGLESLYGTNTGAMENMYGLGPSTLNAYQAEQTPWWMPLATAAIGSAGQVGAAAEKGCWIAAELYGENSPKFWLARNFIFTTWKGFTARIVQRLYLRYGQRIALLLRAHPSLKRLFRPLFDAAIERELAGRL